MPRPKLIQFGEPEPPQQEKAPAQDVFNEKPKKAQKFKPPQKDLSVAPPVEPEPEPEPVHYEEPESPEPQYVTEPVKKTKKPISEKQRLHLEKMRQKRAENRAKQKPPSAPRPARPVEPVMDEDQEFSRWLKNYEKMDAVLTAREEKERKQREEEERKEAEIEARIRKKIEEENKQRMGQSTTPKPQTTSVPVLQQQENRFGQYSSMFGY